MPSTHYFKGLTTLKNLLGNRIIRFLICGVITAVFNIVLLAILIESFKLNQVNQSFFRNLANIASIEVSLIFSFFVYRIWVWPSSSWSAKKIFKQELPLFHLSCGIVIATRSFILFPLLDWAGVNYVVNSLIGIAIGSVMNYVISNKWVFKTTK
jgi:putative flippase GtrA